jgi:hypothetical protein
MSLITLLVNGQAKKERNRIARETHLAPVANPLRNWRISLSRPARAENSNATCSSTPSLSYPADPCLPLGDRAQRCGSESGDSPSGSGLASGAGKMLGANNWRRSRPPNSSRKSTFIIACCTKRPRGLPGRKDLAKLRPVLATYDIQREK